MDEFLIKNYYKVIDKYYDFNIIKSVWKKNSEVNKINIIKMEKFRVYSEKEILNNWTLLAEEIFSIVLQIKEWKSKDTFYCRCSQFPLIQTVRASMGWEIWEQFRLLGSADKETIMEIALELAKLIMSWINKWKF